MNTADYMLEAMKLAEQGMNRGDGGPFGAVIVRGDEIIGKGWNQVLATNDPTAHAEIMAIRDACRKTSSYWLENGEIYVNCEPCPMCLGAIHWARLSGITFAASREDAAAIGFDDAHIYRQLSLPFAERTIKVSRYGREEAVRLMEKWLQLADGKIY